MPDDQQTSTDAADGGQDRQEGQAAGSGGGDPHGDRNGSHGTPQGGSPAGGVDALKADLARERRARQAAERRLEEQQTAGMSELEKAQRRAELAERQLSEERSAALRAKVALDKGLPASLVPRLQGTTEEELAADADELVQLVKPGSPRPDPSQGPRGGDAATTTADLFEQTVGPLFST